MKLCANWLKYCKFRGCKKKRYKSYNYYNNTFIKYRIILKLSILLFVSNTTQENKEQESSDDEEQIRALIAANSQTSEVVEEDSDVDLSP